MRKVLGVLGGIGPMSSVYFYKLITDFTEADKDQDHIDILLSSKASIPDRTQYILDNTNSDPLPIMIEEVKKLANYGAEIIAVACNTAHYFYEALQNSVDVPVINIAFCAVDYLKENNINSVGIMATSGTIFSGIYQQSCAKNGIDCIVPDDKEQEMVMDLIYKDIKSGKAPNIHSFNIIAEHLKFKGAKNIILGCTELSLLKQNGLSDNIFIDPMEILAKKCIIACGYKTKL